MRDKRPVDELTIEELERILAIRKREERQKRLKRLKTDGRVVEPQPKASNKPTPNDAEPIAFPMPPAPPISLPSPSTVAVPAGVTVSTSAAVGEAPRFEDDDLHAYRQPVSGQRIPARTVPPAFAPMEYPRAAEDGRAVKRLVNALLTVVEVAAVAGLIVIGVSLLEAQSNLQRETAEAQRISEAQAVASAPTSAPTPELTIEPIILPGGHKPFVTRPDFEEIPVGISEQMLPIVYEQLLMPIPNRPELRAPQAAQRIFIEKIGVDSPIVPGVDWDAMRQGVGRFLNGTNPGDERGNLVLSAHNDIYGEIFRYLDQLAVGDRFIVETDTQVFTYEITGTDIVDPTDVHVMQQTSTPTATLISCYPYQVNTNRIVVFARRVDN